LLELLAVAMRKVAKQPVPARASPVPRGPGFNISPERSFGYLLRDAARLVISVMTAKIEQHGITLTQYFILRELWEEDGLTPQELAERLRIAGPSIGTSIDAMEDDGLAERVRSRDDKRRVHTHLTAKGRALRTVMLNYAIDVNKIALRGSSAAEIEITKKILQRAKDNLGAEKAKDDGLG
jgi:MarR family transcriptional regulator, organic hydroperoxide resistance regulator